VCPSGFMYWNLIPMWSIKRVETWQGFPPIISFAQEAEFGMITVWVYPQQKLLRSYLKIKPAGACLWSQLLGRWR
jgi:hypothetical protein